MKRSAASQSPYPFLIRWHCILIPSPSAGTALTLWIPLQMYEEASKEVAAGFRAYIVYPLVNESDSEKLEDVKAATLEFEKLQVGSKLKRIRTCKGANLSLRCVSLLMLPYQYSTEWQAFLNDYSAQVAVQRFNLLYN